MAIRFEDLPPQVQNQLQQLQQLQQQYEMVVQQRLQIDIKLKENQNAIDEINKVDENTPIYKSIGNLIVKANKEDVLKELEEEKETLGIRKKALETQETRLKSKIEELQNKIQEALKGGQAG